MGKNELEKWENDTKATKGAVIATILGVGAWTINYLSKSQEQQKISREISECDATIQELQPKWFKSSEQKQMLEDAIKRKKQLLKQSK